MKIQGVAVTDIAKQYGTPIYVYDAAVIEENFLALKNSLPKQVDVFYSIKANPNLSICALLKNKLAGAEVCSLLELETAIKAGYAPGDIIFVGPAKKPEEIKRCLELNIYSIVCESKTELLMIVALAKALHRTARVAIRINPAFTANNAPIKMGGVASQFGIDETQIFQDLTFFFNQPNLNVHGIHIYNGSRILDAETVCTNTENIFALVTKLESRLNRKFSMVDIGGGIGIPYFANEELFDLPKFSQLIQPVITEFKISHPTTRIILESGRYIVGTAGMLVCAIQHIKYSNGETFLITDAGTHCHMAAVGMGSFVKRNFPIVALSSAIGIKHKYNVTGPLCTPGDLLGRAVELTEVQRGDLLGVKSSGAYGPTASPVLFLGHGYPAEILIAHGTANLIRERDTLVDLLRKQYLYTFH